MFKSIAFLLFLVMLVSCRNQEKYSFCVTYRVTGDLSESESMLISYKDSNDYVTIKTTEREWSKDVCLPYDGFASLFVIPQTASVSNHEKKLGKYAYFKGPRKIFCGEIIYQDKTISKRSPEMVSVSLFPLEL